jgi:hypothetical protein
MAPDRTSTNDSLHTDEKAVVRAETDKPLSKTKSHGRGPDAVSMALSAVPAPASLPRLNQPALVPRVHPGATYPLARAWPPELACHGITRDEWLAFLDRINAISFPHPTVWVIEVAAMGVAYAPVDGADGISAALELLADATAFAIAKTRCNNFLQACNDGYFHPRGLHARIVANKAMRRALDLAKDDRLIAPLSEEVVNMSAQERCLAQMRLHSCDLDFDVPEQATDNTQAKVMGRIARWRVRSKVRKRDRLARRSRRRAWKKLQKGKGVWREGYTERHTAKALHWLIVQDLDDYERQKAEVAQEKKRCEAERTAKRRNRLDWWKSRCCGMRLP